MGSPLGPLFANIFLSFHETTWLSSCPTNFKPLLYRRYVDDTFLLFRSRDHIPLFLAYLNRQHPNVNFTCEVETNMAALKPLFIVNLHSQGFSLIFIASLLYNLNVVKYIHYYTAFSIFALNMRIFMLRLSFWKKNPQPERLSDSSL